MGVCLAEDEYTRARYLSHPRWEATLSDGTVALMDDDRPGEAESSAWMRLKAHCEANNLAVTRLVIRFRSHAEAPLPDNAPGYFFRRNLIGWIDGVTHSHFLLGYLGEDGIVHIQRWKVPELILRDQEQRDPADERSVGPSLIFSTMNNAMMA